MILLWFLVAYKVCLYDVDCSVLERRTKKRVAGDDETRFERVFIRG